ncbi:MAG: endonuclease [Clostridiales bacterium]|nr:endonuclease [Clostridiales bacterium]
MDFIDELKQLSTRVTKLKDTIDTEEGTKMSLILPFFQILGYDVFNPDEFMPEYTADVGIKKGEKVDYAIMKDGKPLILIECKSVSDELSKHASQLFRYFGTSEAKFGILTNGLTYKFFTDLDETNKMDLTPFMEFNILDIKKNTIKELKKFQKINFDVESVFSTASELKYSKAIKELFHKQLETPDDDFIRYFLTGIYDGLKTQSVIDKYRDIIKNALNEYISESMNDKISAALNVDTTIEEESEETEEKSKPRIVTTEEELQAFYIIKGMFAGMCQLDDIVYRDTESYFGILYKNNNRKPICRLNLDTKKKQLLLPDENKKFTRYYIDTLDNLYDYKTQIIECLKLYIQEV